MTREEAREIIEDFDEERNYSQEEEFMFIEALDYLIEEEHNPGDMLHLGGYYYEKKQFDLALKYYEMAATYDYDPAYECLGYIWYYGRTGERDFEKAFHYFSKLMVKGDPVATYKVADMYREGYFVEKNPEKYKEIIEDLFPKVMDMENVFDPVPEVFTRMARIRTEEGEEEEAVSMYIYAKSFLAQRIRYNSFFGNLNIMKWLIDDLYELTDFDYKNFDFYDLFYLLKTPHTVSFRYINRTFEVKSVQEGEECSVNFDGKWFHSRDDFFKEASVDQKKLTAISHRLKNFKVVE